MNDDDLKRLIAADIAEHAGDGEMARRVQTSLDAGKRSHNWRRAIFALSLVAVALLVLSGGYWLAAMVLPPIGGGGFAVLLWAPVVVLSVLILAVLRVALLALGE